MVFTETIYPSGRILFKGLDQPTCKLLLRDTRFFYLTDSYRVAQNYGRVCQYQTKKTLRLFDLTHKNIQTLIGSNYPISDETKGVLRIILGTNVTIGEQALAAKILIGKHAGTLPSISNTRRGERLSYKDLNKMAFGNLAKEFLIPEGYDGYYAPKKKSVFHGGSFHSEIMLVNAYQCIENTKGPRPVISHRSFKWALPRIFMDFCKGTTRLTRPYGGDLTIFCTGGMAVRLYLQQRKSKLPPKIRRTADFDFTFAVPRKLPSEKSVESYVYTMRRIMTLHLNAFVRYLNREYKGINASLRINRYKKSPYDNPRVQVPGTGRRVYQVITYQIATGNGELTDLVDTALAVYPRSSRSMLHLPFSYKIGIPIQKLRYQLKDALAILSGSFVYKGLIAKRNPITGAAKNKGAKNVERVRELAKLVRSQRKYYANLVPAVKKVGPLLEDIGIGNTKAARNSAKNVNKVLRKIR